MMKQQVRNSRERDPSPPSLLIAAHCSTIRRKSERLDTKELAAILDDLVRELNSSSLRLKTYLNSLNEIIKTLNSTSPPALLQISSHYFFSLVRDRIRNLLEQLYTNNRLSDQELYILRNCTVLIHDLVKKIEDVARVLHWITNETFLDALAKCLNNANKISKRNENKNAIKQIARLLSAFCNIQERLPIGLHQNLFERLLQPTINCLISPNYIKLFQHLKPDADRLTEVQKLYLIRCPHFLTSYNGPFTDNAIEQVFEKMLPRYVSILNKHMKTIKQWNRPMMRAVHNLIVTIIYVEDYFSSSINNESFRTLLDHLLQLLNEPTLVSKIRPNSNNVETLIIDATIIVFSILVYEPNALEYMKKRKSAEIFRKLTTTSCETIVLNAYMLLVYTISDDDIKTSQDDLPKLLSTTVNLLRKLIRNRHQKGANQENIDRNILQLVETLKGLAQYEQIKNKILKEGILSLLVGFYDKLHGLSKQVLLECLWTLSFNEEIAAQLREYTQFILSLQNIQKSDNDNNQPNTLRRTHSFSNLRKNNIILSNEPKSNAIKKMADGLLWKIVTEPQYRKAIVEKLQKQTEKNGASDNLKYKYDVMISHSLADRGVAYQIQQMLIDQGYKIWFDRSRSHKQAMEIVAEAIENSEFVILCLSDSYKRDNHCQAEAEYAVNSKRSLLPLIIHNSYKPDGWLSSIIDNSTCIDFGSSDSKAASKLLLKEIKQRQHKNRTVEVKRRESTSAVSIVQSPPGSLSASDKPDVSLDHTKSGTAISSTSSSLPSDTVNKQQQQQQQQTSTRSVSRSPTSDSMSTTATSVVVNKEQHAEAPVHNISRPSTSGSNGSIASGAVTKEQQQTSTLTAGTSTIPASVHKEHQPPQIPVRPISRTLPASFMPSDSSVTVQKQQQRPPIYPRSTPLTSDINKSTTSTINDKQQQQTTVQSTSRSSTPGYVPSSSGGFVVDKQQTQEPVHSLQQPLVSAPGFPITTTDGIKQQQEITTRSASRASTSSTISSDASVNIEKKQQQLVTNAVSSTASATLVQQQQQQQRPMHSVTQSIANGTVPSTTSNVIDQEQHHQTGANSASRLPTTSPVLPATSTVVVQQQQQTPIHSSPHPLTNGIAPSLTSVVIDKQQQETQVRSRSPSSDSGSSDASTVVDEEQPQQITKYSVSQPLINNTAPSITSKVLDRQQQRQQQIPIHSPRQPLTNGIDPSLTSVVINKQRLETQVLRLSSATESISSDASTVLDQQQLLQATKYSVSQPLINNTTPSITSKVLAEQQRQQQIRTHSPRQPLTNGNARSIAPTANNKQRQETPVRSLSRSSTPGSVHSAASSVVNKQLRETPTRSILRPTATSNMSSAASIVSDRQQQTSAQSVLKQTAPAPVPSVTLAVDNKQQQPVSVDPMLRSSVPATIPSIVSTTDNKQQEQISTQSISRSSISGSSSSVISNDIKKQQEQQQHISSRTNSRSTTPVGSSTNSVPPRPPTTNISIQRSLPQEYLNRKTQNSTYRTLSINAWRNNDVLDFLFDLNLYAMMPLCESMSGKALTRLFRMCQTKPSRLYGQLNQELRARFKGLSLPMGVYTQFLIEMDALVGPAPDSLLSLSPSRSSVVDRGTLTPRTPQQQLEEDIQPSSRPSTRSAHSPSTSKSATPVEIISRTTTPHQTRIVERATFRPALFPGRPYNFIVESVEESTELLQQIERYGPQLLSLDEKAHQYRQINNSVNN